MSASPTVVANFLADFSVKRTYSSVKVARSTLSSTLSLKPGSGEGVGNDLLFVNLLKGILNQSLSAPRYIDTLDPDTALSFFYVHAAADLSILELSRKCVILIALCTLIRTLDISSIFLGSICFSDYKLSFTLGRPRKAQSSGPLKQFLIDAWPETVPVCPVNCVKLYIDRTSEFRNAHNFSFLIMSSTKPHKTVSPSTIGRWIQSQLGLAGIDTSSFSTYSTRPRLRFQSSQEQPARNGLPIQAILDRGH